ncbi:MAG: TIGR03790 family protein [Verrucomicrobia bacterium]|nr:TIGR03790 family protein [Verrucomicrobiota bacterium]
MIRFLLVGWAAVLGTAAWAQPSAPVPSSLPDLAAHTLIVFNKADPDSPGLAETYAKARSIPADRVIGLECALTEEITRADFEATIRKPLEDLFQSRGWMKRTENFLPNPVLGLEGSVPVQQSKENPIWVMVLMRGMPLKIAEDPTILAPENLMNQLRANAASVDSELALLPIQGLPLYGLIANPYFADKRIRPFSSFFANYLILVTRLDGPSPGIVRRMIQDAVEVEKTELTGRAFFDLRSIEKKEDPYRLGDEWIERAALLFQARGFEVEIDRRPEVAPKYAPWDQIAFYAGWYTGDFQGPFELPTARFRRGAIAYHIHSFSAETVRSETKNWVGPLLSHGATATMGAVYEPYLRFTPDISLFVSALLSGLSFAEAAYQSQLSLSWMVTMVGDPLYRPFPRNFYENLDAAQTANSPDLPWFRLRKVRLLANAGSLGETKAAVAKLVEDFPGNEITLEGGADIYRDLNEKKEAAELYEKALDQIGERAPRDRLRLLMKLAELNRRDDKARQALQLYEKLMEEFPEAAKSLGLGDRAVAFASGESLELPPTLAKYKQEVEEAQIAAAVAKAAAQPPAQVKPEATAADQAAVLKAATPRPTVSEPAMGGSPSPAPAPAATNTPAP